jgi:hypothetical protein
MRLGGNYLGQDVANQDLQLLVRRLEAAANEAHRDGQSRQGPTAQYIYQTENE